MFVNELRHAIEAAPRCRLSEVAKVLWSAVAGGQIDEIDAEQLSNLIDARRVLPMPVPARKSGTKPRTPTSIERRRRWAASGALPVGLAARFTVAEQAALAVVAGEVAAHGRCDLYVGHIAGLAGVSETVVRNALRAAKKFGLVAIEIRRVTAWRNESNLVTIVSPEWAAWLARGGRQGGCRSAPGTISSRSTRKAQQSISMKTEEMSGLGREGHRGGEGSTQTAPPTYGMPSRIAWEGRTGRSRLYPLLGA